jgi:putative ABC transport system permease protein
MFRNYFRTALKNLRNNRLYSFVNITGFSIGIASCMLIFLYIQYELSYDRYNKNADRIYRLTEILHLPKEDNARAVSSPPMAYALQSSLPEILKTVRINFSARSISYNEKKIHETIIIYADSTLFDIFTFPMIQGNPHTALVNPYSIVLTETTAKKYFGTEPAFGKTMKLSDTINLTVTGIIRDIPENSHLSFDCILSRTTIFELNQQREDNNWFDNNYWTYLLLPPGHNHKTLEPKIDAVIEKAMVEARKETGLWYNFKLQPITDIHLRSDLRAEIRPNSDIRYVYIFSAAAILILLIACINFINLSTARSVKRSKEIGLRKVAGARRGQLITQFLSESSLYAMVAGACAIGLILLALPYFNQFTGKDLSLDYLLKPTLLFTYIGIILAVGFLAGLYPALLMSSFKPVKAIKESIKHGWQDVILRKGLVIFQFTISIILISSTTLIFEQLRFLQNKKIGMNKDLVLEIPIRNQDLSKTKTIRDELRKISSVSNVSITNFSFKEGLASVATLPEGANENELSSHLTVAADENFLNTFQIPLVTGRNFSDEFPTDTKESFIVNETAVKYFGWGTPQQSIGKTIDWGLGKKGKVIGVVKDFNFTSLHDNIRPLIIHLFPDDYGFVAVLIKPGNINQTIRQIENTWKNTAVYSPFSYSFVNEDFDNLYKAEHNMQTVLGLFTLLSVFISCLGIFGLAAFTIRQRIKEIGVRKVLGATVSNIAGLLSKDFIKLVIFAATIASPIAYFGIYKWLESFAYRINISWWIFLIAGIAAIVIAITTVSFQAIKAAMANPVKSLRTE